MHTKGLQGVVAAETAISDIDGEQALLRYSGYDVKELAEHSFFEEVVFLLHYGRLPTVAELDEFSAQLVKERELDHFTSRLMPTMAEVTSPMSMLRTIVSASSAYDPDGWEVPENDAANLRKSIRLVARVPQMIAAYWRLSKGRWPVDPDPEL
ncbi:MAG: citrate/2-methylcitrate synthase, partial [Candidatus Methylomirabilales bacterium]